MPDPLEFEESLIRKRQSIATRINTLRSHVDAELSEILKELHGLPQIDGARDFLTAVHLVGSRIDVEREADSIALAGAALREAMQPRLRGTLMNKVRKALGYTY